ncbi:MAG: hypothetical protein PVF58_09650 [Candidatus Methanofastidiosia archaeon]|jgi:hypothetical protein
MRFPSGTNYSLQKGVYPQEVLDSMTTGYARLTMEKNGLNDYYILFSNNDMVGAVCEFSDGRTLHSTDAVEHILSLREPVLAETAEYTSKMLETIKREHPEIFLSPDMKEKFKVGSTIFEGVLAGVKSGDLLEILKELEIHTTIGCLRVTRETEETIQEGVILFLETPVAAMVETGDSILLGDSALREVALSFTKGRIYTLDRDTVEKFLILNNASRLKSPVEEMVASEKASEDLKRYMALKQLGLDRGTLVLNAPCNGTFSFEALLRSAASRKFNGYLWVRSEAARGIMVLVRGKIQGAYTTDASGDAKGLKALRKIYDDMESRGRVDFYQLSVPPEVSQPFETEGETDDVLMKQLLGEMGGDLAKEVALAKEFKKRWQDKREQGE